MKVYIKILLIVCYVVLLLLLTIKVIDSTSKEAFLHKNTIFSYNQSKKGVKKFWWNSSLTEVKSSSIKHFEDWKRAGRPTEGPIYDAKFKAHRNYKKSVKLARSNSNKMISDNLQRNLLSSNNKKF